MPVGWRWASQGIAGASMSGEESASAAKAVGAASLDIATLFAGRMAGAVVVVVVKVLQDGKVVVRGRWATGTKNVRMGTEPGLISLRNG